MSADAQARLDALLAAIEEHLPAYTDTDGERLGSVERVIAAGAALRAAAPVEYRAGAPSAEVVRLHELRTQAWALSNDVPLASLRGGHWQAIDPESAIAPHEAQTVSLKVAAGAVHLSNGYAFWQPLADCKWAARSRYRPCLPDGTPCAWPAAAPGAAP